MKPKNLPTIFSYKNTKRSLVIHEGWLVKTYTVGRNTYKFRMNNMCNTFFLFEHIILLLENCTGNKDTSFKSWIQPYEKHIDLIEMTIERMDPCSVQ